MTHHFRRLVYGLFSLLLVTRLAAMAFIPLTDDTEARYGEVARKMAESGNWITPMGLHGPFWAKPPLSTWVSALSMHWFGVSAFTARLPNLLLMILTITMVGVFVAQKRDRDAGLMAALVGASMLLVYVVAGTVMTDTTLVFSTTWALLAFWQTRETGKKVWGYVFFAGLGLGLLAKGPVALVMAGLPIFIWALWERDLKGCIRCTPWIGGMVLMLLIAVPWYLLAEHATPGFLRYFFIGENIERFINPQWTGDKFGSNHLHPYGAIWLFWLAAALPWSLFIIGWLFKARKSGLKHSFGPSQSLHRYLLVAAFIPEIFFSFASNIISTYPLTGLPPLAALFTLVAWEKRAFNRNSMAWLALFSVVIGVAAILIFQFKPGLVKASQKPVIAYWQAQRPSKQSPLDYYRKYYYSSYFYSRGQVGHLNSPHELGRYLNAHPRGFVAFHHKEALQLPKRLQQRLQFKKRFGSIRLYEGQPRLLQDTSK